MNRGGVLAIARESDADPRGIRRHVLSFDGLGCVSFEGCLLLCLEQSSARTMWRNQRDGDRVGVE